jgi:rhodanese-related sulfurtransferase
VAALLEKNGYSDIRIGGITEWKEKGYDVLHPKASELTAGDGEAK